MENVFIAEEPVEWTVENDNKYNYCVGKFREDVNRPFIIKETNNAPIDVSTLKSRIYLNNHSESKFNPLSEGYFEDFIKIITSKPLSDEDLKEIQFSFVKEENKDNLYQYFFKVDTRDEEF